MKENAGSKIETTFVKLGAWSLGGLLFVIFAVWGGHRYYRHWEQGRLEREANAFFEKGDNRSAILTAQRALQINPSNVAACRILAEISERLNSRGAIDWRHRVVDLLPAVTAEKLAWARAALRFNEPETADLALGEIPQDQRETAAYHDVAAQLALARTDLAGAQTQAHEAVRMDPANGTYRLHLAALQLQSGDFREAEAGRQTLNELAQEATLRVPALRALIDDALRGFHEQHALELAQQLRGLPEATFRDRLLYLHVLEKAKSPDFEAQLDEVKSLGQNSPDNAADLISWFTAENRAGAALEWVAKLPPEMASKMPVPVALSYAYLAAKDWSGLQSLVKNANWGDQDFLRLALLARALREQGDEAGFSTQWANAMKKAAKGEQAMPLSQTLFDWGWKDEALDLLWRVNDNPAVEERVLRALSAYYLKTNDTSGLYRVALHLNQLHPADTDIANNVAQLSLLLNLDVLRGQKMARDLYEKNRANPAYVSTYAFSLFLNGEIPQALQVMGGLTAAQLQDPAVAAYYGIILAAAGEKDRARPFLDRGSQANLLPEERELIARARRSVGS
ncbi:MAG: hypothetical protein M3Z22_06795 [Verrucomicrobiota bacterium]|nr:hypothetical protein [Verrucomicrobiota bacterium]